MIKKTEICDKLKKLLAQTLNFNNKIGQYKKEKKRNQV